MRRYLLALAVSLLACAAFAAPAPERFVSGWGKPVDPDRDCKIRRGNGALIIEMPGRDHDYDPIRKRDNAPRIVRHLESDFDIQVRVRIDSRPSALSTVKGQPSYVSAGFLLIYAKTGRVVCSRMEYGVMQQGIGVDEYGIAQMLVGTRRSRAPRKGIGEEGFAMVKHWICKNQDHGIKWDRERLTQHNALVDRGWMDWPFPKKRSDYVYMRLEQHGGGRFHFFMSPDGEKWTRMGGLLGPPPKVTLGLAAYSTSSEPSKVRFDQLKLTRGKRKNPQRKEPLFEPSTVQVRRP